MDPDLMLIKLNKDAPAGSSTVHLPTDCINNRPPNDIQTTALLLAGWGEDENGNYPLQLQCVRLQGTTSLAEAEFCAGRADEGTGEADSGGGLVHTGRNTVYGVVVSHCWLDPNGPSLRSQFVNVCHFLQWIQNEMNAHP
ncbi:kallikrein-4-like [Megalops cyprinoides]|uniref:kallikrein-4-like n=1 Tax=Megalops cyprinoides TaxID=118141 RepID=UPI001864880B|nr:kallikrein-4-like [Megalops cyprinoides]